MSFLEKVDCPYIQHHGDRIYQGDIYKDLRILLSAEQINDELLINKMDLMYAVVITQDCDLQQDFNRLKNENSTHNNSLLSILICPAYQAEIFKNGLHIPNQQMRTFHKNEFEKLKNNDSERRYHWLPEHGPFRVPEAIIDFKHYYTIPPDIFYSFIDKSYIATITSLFRENLSHRFCNYLGRIGLPEIVASHYG